MSESGIADPGAEAPMDGMSLARAVIRGLTWRRVAITESIGLFAILMRYVEAGGTLTPTDGPTLAADLLSIVPLLILLAALCADQFVLRGRAALPSYSICLIVAVCSGTAAQCALQTWIRANFAPDPAMLILHSWSWFAYDALDGLLLGAVGMFVFHSRRSVVRVLNRLRTAELSRVHLEQSLIESRLAAAQTQMDSSAMLSSLREIGDLYRTAPEEADARFDSFVESLQSRRSSFRHLKA